MLVDLPTPSSSTIVCYYLLQLFENLLSDVVVLINPNANVTLVITAGHIWLIHTSRSTVVTEATLLCCRWSTRC
jgi:hypothetical protein